MTTRVIDMPAQRRAAEVVPQSINDTDRTVTVLWSTGAAVRCYNADTGELCDEVLSLEPGSVDLSRLENGAAFLNMHNSYDLNSILGVVTRAWVENGQGLAQVRFDTSDDANEAFRKIKAGILRSVSIGYTINQYERVERAGQVPLYRAVDWQPFEISAVCVGADAGAGFRNKPSTNQCVIIETREKPMNKPTEETPDNPTKEKPEGAAAEGTNAGKEGAAAEEAAVATAVEAERKRCADIMAAAGKLGVPESFARSLINQGVSLTRAQTALIDHAAENSPTAGIRSQQQGGSKAKEENDPDLPLEVRAKAEWEKDASLHKEFRSYDTYFHYKRAMESGKVRIKSN